MSDKKKTKEKKDMLDFSDLDGGTVEVERKTVVEDTNLPTIHPDDPIATKEREAFSSISFLGESDINLPIPTSNGNYIIKNIYKTTGEEFIAWMKNLPLCKPSWDPKPEDFDGPDYAAKRIKYCEQAMERHSRMTVHSMAAKKIFLDKIIN